MAGSAGCGRQRPGCLWLGSGCRAIDASQFAYCLLYANQDANHGSLGYGYRYTDGHTNLNGHFLANQHTDSNGHGQPASHSVSYCDSD